MRSIFYLLLISAMPLLKVSKHPWRRSFLSKTGGASCPRA